MKKNKIIFWIATGLISALMLMSSSMYLTKNPQLIEGFKTLGYPLYMLNILGVAKLLAAIALVQTKFPKLREWAYAGLAFTLLGAVWSHVATGSPFVMPIVFLGILVVSYLYNSKLNKAKAI